MQKIPVKALIFDRDGVIINSDVVVIKAAREAFAQLGFTLLDEDIPQITGRSYRVYTDYFLQKWDFDAEEYYRIIRELFYANLDAAPYFEEAVKLIKKLHGQKIPLAITTSAGREGTLLILEKAGIAGMFDVIVTKEDCKNLKPDPEPYALTAKKLGITPELCLAIEDTALGVESAKKAGLKCIAIPNEHTRDQDFSLADKVVTSGGEVERELLFAS